MTDDRDPEEVFVGLLDGLLEAEDARKASIETRAFAAVTVDLSLVTLYIAASSHSSRIAKLVTGETSNFMSAAFALVLASLVLSFGGALPFAYGTFKIPGIEKLNKSIAADEITTDELREQIRVVRVKQLRSSRRLNGWKVALLFAAAGSSAAAVFCFVLALWIST